MSRQALPADGCKATKEDLHDSDLKAIQAFPKNPNPPLKKKLPKIHLLLLLLKAHPSRNFRLLPMTAQKQQQQQEHTKYEKHKRKQSQIQTF